MQDLILVREILRRWECVGCPIINRNRNRLHIQLTTNAKVLEQQSRLRCVVTGLMTDDASHVLALFKMHVTLGL